MVASHHVVTGELNLGPMQEQQVCLTQACKATTVIKPEWSCHEDSPTDQQKQTKNPNTLAQGHIIFDKGSKTVQSGKDSLKQWGLGKSDINMHMNEIFI